MSQELLKLIQDSQTGLWLVFFTPGDPENSLFGQEGQVQDAGFESDEARDIVLAQLNGDALELRYVASDRPPVKPPNP